MGACGAEWEEARFRLGDWSGLDEGEDGDDGEGVVVGDEG